MKTKYIVLNFNVFVFVDISLVTRGRAQRPLILRKMLKYGQLCRQYEPFCSLGSYQYS